MFNFHSTLLFYHNFIISYIQFLIYSAISPFTSSFHIFNFYFTLLFHHSLHHFIYIQFIIHSAILLFTSSCNFICSIFNSLCYFTICFIISNVQIFLNSLCYFSIHFIISYVFFNLLFNVVRSTIGHTYIHEINYLIISYNLRQIDGGCFGRCTGPPFISCTYCQVI